jgi:hypothetical protein
MKNYEEFLEIKEKMAVDTRRIPGLQMELVAKERAQAGLDEATIRAETLAERGADKLAAAAEENRKAVIKLREEIKKLQKKIEIMNESNNPRLEAALKDLREHYRAALEPLVAEFIKRARTLQEVEKQIDVLRDEAHLKMAYVTPYPRVVFPWIPGVLLIQGEIHIQQPFRLLLKSLKEEGFDVGEEK